MKKKIRSISIAPKIDEKLQERIALKNWKTT